MNKGRTARSLAHISYHDTKKSTNTSTIANTDMTTLLVERGRPLFSSTKTEKQIQKRQTYSAAHIC